METAVIWLQKALESHLTHDEKMQFEGLFQQAIDMEKTQIMDAWLDGFNKTYIENSEYFYYYYKYNQDISDWDITLMDGLEDENFNYEEKL